MMVFTEVTPAAFAAWQKSLVGSGHQVTAAEVPTGQTPTVYNVHGHGLELHATYSGTTLSVEVVKKPLFVRVKHIEEEIQEGLGQGVAKSENKAGEAKPENFDFSKLK